MKNTKQYQHLKAHYCQNFPQNINKHRIKKIVEKYNYIPLPFSVAKEELSDVDIFVALDTMLQKECKHPLEDLGYTTNSWLHQEQHKIETLCLSGFKDSESGFFRNYLIKIITTPKGNAKLKLPATTFYLLPPYRRDMAFSSVYCPISTEIEVEDSDLKNSLNWDGETQLRFFIELSQKIGHPVIMDLLPQAGRFSKTVFAHPECFLWSDLQPLAEQLTQKVHEITHRMQLQGFATMMIHDICGLPLFEASEVEKQVLNALRMEYNSRRIQLLRDQKFVEGGDKGVSPAKLKEYLLKDIENVDMQTLTDKYAFSEEITHENFCQLYGQLIEIDYLLDKERAHFSTQQFLDAAQSDILQKVQTLIYENVGLVHNENELSDAQHKKLIDKCIAANLWPISGGCWNSCGYPIFRRMSTDNYPVCDHYNYKGNFVSAFAGDMDIISPWHFAAPCKHDAQNNLNYHIIKKYIAYCHGIYERFRPNGFRLDHVDHSADYPVSVNEKGNFISYRAPLLVFAELAKKIQQQQPTFAFLAEYMGWGDDNHPHLYHEYAENSIGTAISLDIVGEYRHNAQAVIKETNQQLEKFNKKYDKQCFTLTHILDNHDRSHPDIVRALSDFTADRALLKWVKCIFLPGGRWAQRSTVYLDGNDTLTPNKEFAQIFLNTVPLNRAENTEFFTAFSALYRYSLNDRTLRYGKAQLILSELAEENSNNAISAWMVLEEQDSQQGYLVVCNEFIDDNTAATPEKVDIEIPPIDAYHIEVQLVIPQNDTLSKNCQNIPQVTTTQKCENLTLNADSWVFTDVKHNEFRIFRLKKDD